MVLKHDSRYGGCPTPENVHTLIPGICEHVIFHDTRNFLYVIRIRDLKPNYLGLFKWAQLSRELSLAGSDKGKLVGKVREIQSMRRTQPAIADFEDEGGEECGGF